MHKYLKKTISRFQKETDSYFHSNFKINQTVAYFLHKRMAIPCKIELKHLQEVSLRISYENQLHKLLRQKLNLWNFNKNKSFTAGDFFLLSVDGTS